MHSDQASKSFFFPAIPWWSLKFDPSLSCLASRHAQHKLAVLSAAAPSARLSPPRCASHLREGVLECAVVVHDFLPPAERRTAREKIAISIPVH
ncbi:hypothetical protein RB195_014509 [Necator americanus]|uniref:Uncharacterized protein n=1 Tax=Necator americanus TaxID=51031 RepID=A0ABR1E0L2_NECAM